MSVYLKLTKSHIGDTFVSILTEDNYIVKCPSCNRKKELKFLGTDTNFSSPAGRFKCPNPHQLVFFKRSKGFKGKKIE